MPAGIVHRDGPRLSLEFLKPNWKFSTRSNGQKAQKHPCNQNGLSVQAEKRSETFAVIVFFFFLLLTVAAIRAYKETD